MLAERCELLRSLHVPGRPLVLTNAWDAASAKAIVAARFPVVATTSAGVAEALGYEDHEQAPSGEMLAAAARIIASVDVPVTVDAEAGYGLAPPDLVEALLEIGAAGCNLEDTDHRTEQLRDPEEHADRLAAVRLAASERDYGLVINARVDVFIADRGARPQIDLLDEAVERAGRYLAAGADCVYPILLRDPEGISAFVDAVEGPLNILAAPEGPSIARLAEFGVARVSYGPLLYRRTMQHFGELLADIV